MQSMKMINIVDLIPSKTNPRKTFDKKQLDELTESIKEKGVVQPILCRPLKISSGQMNISYEIVSGERRYRAAKAAALTQIPAMIKDLDDRAAMEIQVIENLHRADVHPLEEAEGYEILMNQKGCYLNIDDLAMKVGKSKSYVYGRMKLCALIPAARKKFIEGELSASISLLIARIPESLQKKAMEDILEDYNGPMGYREAKEHLEEEFMVHLDHAPFDTKDATLCPKAGPCTTCPKRSGSTPDLFPDIKRTDVCTDTICFRAKREAAANIKIAEAEKTGAKIYRGEAAERVINAVKYSSSGAYIELGKTCYEDAKSRSYAKLIGNAKSLQDSRVLAVGKEGELVECYPRQAVNEALKAAGHKLAKERNSDSGRSAEILKSKIGHASAHKAIDAIMEATTKRESDLTLRFLIQLIHRSASADAIWNFMKRINPNTKMTESRKALDILVKNMPLDQAIYFSVEMLLCDNPYFTWSGVSNDIQEGCKMYGIDLKKIEKATSDELKVERNKGSKKTASKT